jgi:hypothetical protein
MHSKSFICHCVLTWKNYLHLLANWMHSKNLICEGVPSWKNHLHLLANWMHSKSFICESVLTWKNYLHLLANWMIRTISLVKNPFFSANPLSTWRHFLLHFNFFLIFKNIIHNFQVNWTTYFFGGQMKAYPKYF